VVEKSRAFASRAIQQGSIFWSENDIYPHPPSENDIFPPLATRRFSTPIVAFLIKFFPVLQLFYPLTSPFISFFRLSSFFFYIFPLYLLAFSSFSPK
jgi:hypothetical protein